MPNKKLNVAVLMGGKSAEHEVSLDTGRNILHSLDKGKYSIKPIVISKDGSIFGRPTSTGRRTSKDFLRELSDADVVFIALHGPFGEDGTIQGLLEQIGVPYTGSGVLASSLAMDKIRSGELFRFHGLLVPRHLSFKCHCEEGALPFCKRAGRLTKQSQKSLCRHDEIASSPNPFGRPTSTGRRTSKRIGLLAMIGKAEREIGFPCVVKPADLGSSVGVAIVQERKELGGAIKNALKYRDRVLVQEYIKGDEVACGILDDGLGRSSALPPIQIIPQTSKFFDFQAKYTPQATKEVIPPRMSRDLIRGIQSVALEAHRILGCKGLSRADMIVQKEKIYLLEVNTIPGMTKTSLYPQEVEAAGIGFSRALDRIIRVALT